ncbi:SMEK domain-containing protein [Flagellimonas sp. HMM57]|uniref:SMEK domain-containing protein n=1 Tax=unclassified Flagellimonas TaxID=2644544 RepID=UPI0013D0D2C9|nr:MULTISPECIES: SMEK domain-containing protein [unclassified Flagellimonas]UII77827.1 SMEK domain-containing protein [Flagellimonas sp. HMM57]
MSLIDFQHLHQQIKNKLFEISYKIDCFNQSGDTDISRYAETYFKGIFNIVYKKDNWNFSKSQKINQDTYDLFDEKNKICIQITSNKRQSKKDKTIQQFENKHYQNGFNTLIILFTTQSKPKKNKNPINFDYQDFNIIEFCGLIEDKCEQTELLKIRDILLNNNELPRNRNKTAKKSQNKKVSQREFLRRKKIEKELIKELLIEDFWDKIDREELAKLPIHKFKDSRFILRSISDESYPNVDENSKWSRTFMYDFYEKGILIWLDAVSGTEALVNENMEWYILEYGEKNKEFEKGFQRVKIRILGELPFKNIVYWEDGDAYYNDYHLFCKYDGIDETPFDKIVYRFENTLGYFWRELDIDKRIK